MGRQTDGLGWLASVRAVGLRGRRAPGLDIVRAVDLLVAGIQGRQRRSAVRRRIVQVVHEQLRLHTGGGDAARQAPETGRHVLHTVLPAPAWDDPDLAAGAAELALAVADPDLLGQVGTWLGGERGTDLCALAEAEAGEPTLAVLDIETSPARRREDEVATVDEVSVVVARGARVLRRLDLGGRNDAPFDAGTVSSWLTGHIVVAHNGAPHDFPILEANGVTVPQARFDTLRWAWLGFPTAASHALASLAELLGVEAAGDRHTAAVDTDLLCAVVPHLVSALRSLPGPTRQRLAELLGEQVAPEVLDLLLPDAVGDDDRSATRQATSGDEAGDDADHGAGPAAWQATSAANTAAAEPQAQPRPGPRSVEQCPDLASWQAGDPGQLVVVRDLRDAPAAPGRWAAGERLVDPAFVDGEPPPGSVDGRWAQAVALRVLDAGDGLVAFWPPSATQLLEIVPRRPAGRYVAGEGPWVTDLGSVQAEVPDRPAVLLDAVDLLFSGEGLDPADMPVPVTAVVNHAGPVRPAMTTLWEKVLGGPAAVTGTPAAPAASVTVVQGIPANARDKAATARSLAVAAGRARESATVYVTSGHRADAIVAATSREARSRLGAPLLRPPSWPTVSEAVHRLREGPHLAVSTAGPAPRLASSGAELVLDRIGAPASDLSLVERLLDSAEDAYGDVIEPVAALRLLRLLTAAEGAVWVCDPVADNPLIRAALSSVTPATRAIADLEDTEVGRWAAAAVLNAAATTGPTESEEEVAADPGEHLAGAVRRLLGPQAELRSEQRTVVDAVLDGHDVLAVFRTGFGKSLCYQAPALALGASGHGATVVVSPLLALQRDQVDTLRSQRIWEATVVNSELAPDVRAARLRGIRAGFYRLVYVAPEGLQSEGVQDALREAGVGLVAVDEAHCISEMGHDFRPDYRTIPTAVRRILGLGDTAELADLSDRPRMLALTGTASPQTRDDITERLEGRFRRHVDSQFVRPELTFEVVRVEEDPDRAKDRTVGIAGRHPQRWRALLDTLDGSATPAIIYAPTRRDTEDLAAALAEEPGCPGGIEPYHGGLAAEERARVERSFLGGECEVVVATNAFGMGIDKGDVRTVVHWRMPGSPEALYQEAGRAGRGTEGQPARCVVLYHPSDLAQATRIASWSVPDKGEFTRVWSTLEELHRLQGEIGSVVVSDDDLVRLAGLRDGIEPRVVVAHLARSGLIEERGRQPAATVVIPTGAPLPPDLGPTEQAIARMLLPHERHTVPVEPARVADQLGAQGLVTSVWDVRSALRHLQSVGVIEFPPPRVGLVALASDPEATVGTAWRDAKRVAAQIPEIGWVTVRPDKVGLPADRILTIVELLSALGCIKVGRQGRGGQIPGLRLGRRPLKELTRLAEISPAVVADAAASKAPLLDLAALAADHKASEPEIREALLVGHLVRAVMLDPRSWESWERSGPSGACREISINGAEATAGELIDEAVEATRTRNHDAELRRRALDAYAALDVAGDDHQAYQRFLERYFTDPTFLADIEARTTRVFLDGLDTEQLAAVQSDARQLVIRAGAGTGKTRTLTRRIAYRVGTGHLQSDVLAVCFNRQAASEMAERLAALGMPTVQVRTLNAVGARIVREHWPKLGRDREPEVIDEKAQRNLVARLVAGHDSSSKVTPNAVLTAIQRAKLGRWAPGEAAGTGRVPADLVNKVYADYEAALVADNQMDFQDQILHPLRLLDDPDVTDHICGPLREIFVDEAQDLSVAEWALVDALSSGAALTVVGDPRQAINEWKGAEPALFDRQSDQPAAVTIDLVRNYRSRAELLDAPNRLMATYPALVAVDTRSGATRGGSQPDEKAHDDDVAATVAGWIDDGIADDEIAVLCRTREQIDRIAKRLKRDGVRTRSLGLPPLHTTAAFRIAEARLPDAYDPEIDDMASAMAELASRSDVEEEIRAGAADVSSSVDGDIDGDADDNVWSDWRRLITELVEQERCGTIDPAEALRKVASDSSRTGSAAGGVVVTTVHSSKGLEWDAVVVAEATDKAFRDKPEDRRLAYVALTRARRYRRLVAHATGGGPSRVFGE